MDKKKSSQDAVRKSREKKKKMIEEKQMEKDNMEQEVQTLENELSYEKEKQLFLQYIQNKNPNEITHDEQQKLQQYILNWFYWALIRTPNSFATPLNSDFAAILFQSFNKLSSNSAVMKISSLVRQYKHGWSKNQMLHSKFRKQNRRFPILVESEQSQSAYR